MTRQTTTAIVSKIGKLTSVLGREVDEFTWFVAWYSTQLGLVANSESLSVRFEGALLFIARGHDMAGATDVDRQRRSSLVAAASGTWRSTLQTTTPLGRAFMHSPAETDRIRQCCASYS